MSKIWYLSPSCQAANIGINGYGSEKEQMYLLTEAIVPHLDRAGVSFHVADKDLPIGPRCSESNEMGAAFHFALHSNAGGGGAAYGPVAFYYSEGGKQLGLRMVDALLKLGQETNRSEHVTRRKDLCELRETKAPALLLEVDFHDSVKGVSFITQRRKEIAEAIARVIIQADGKEFVPATPGELVEEAVQLGLFSWNTDWSSPVTKEDAAILAVHLKHLLERGCGE